MKNKMMIIALVLLIVGGVMLVVLHPSWRSFILSFIPLTISWGIFSYYAIINQRA